MVKLSERSRKVLRRIYQGLGAATISLLFQACYGMPMDTQVMYGMPPDAGDDVSLRGLVSSAADAPIPGIKVSVRGIKPFVFTDNWGAFTITVPKQDLYLLQFKDVDGPENGFYKTLEKMILLNDKDTPLNIKLDEANEE